MDLYGLDPSTGIISRKGYIEQIGDIHLWPREDGEYQIGRGL
jgi:hypothetical protein